VQIRCPVGVEHAWIVPRQIKVSNEDAQDTFHMFDRRRVGYFVEKDVRRVFAGSGDQYMEFTNRFDVNRDGKVEFDEFKQILDEFVSQKGDLSLFERIYVTFSEPSSSVLARWFSLIIMTLIVVSTAAFVLDTMPAFKVYRKDHDCCGLNHGTYSKYQTKSDLINSFNTSTPAYRSMMCPCEPESPYIFYLVELVCIIVFTFEYLARLLTVWASRFGPEFEIVLDVVNVPRNQRYVGLRRTYAFVFNLMNAIDLFAILPFYIALLEASSGGSGSGLGFLRVLRLARVFRVFKMGKYNKGMQLFSKVMMHSAPALKLLCFFTLIGMVLFGSMIYFFEKGFFVVTQDYPNGAFMRPDVTGLKLDVSPFTSIPACFWWVIVTQTTVGYGDSYPTSDVGKVIGSVCMITGVLVLALPITIIGANFANEYAKVQAEEARERHLHNAKLQKEAAEAKRGLLKEMREEARQSQMMILSPNTVRMVKATMDQPSTAKVHMLDAENQHGIEMHTGGELATDECEGGGDGGLAPLDCDAEESDDDDMENDIELVQNEMSRVSSELIGLVRDYIEEERLTKLAGESILSEVNVIMAFLDKKDATHVPAEPVHSMLTLAWHWIKRCETDESVALFPEHKLQLLRKLWEFSASTVRADPKHHRS